MRFERVVSHKGLAVAVTACESAILTGCMRGDMPKPKTLEDVIKAFAMRFKSGPTDLNDKTMASMFAQELATKIRRWEKKEG